jgi:hypothetical protein
MRRTLITALVPALLALTACHHEEEPPAPPVTDAQLTELRNTYHSQDSQARVGVVTAVLESSNLASVGKVPVKDFAVGDIITFMDSNGKVLTLGKVEAINFDTVTVLYTPPTDKGTRAPAVGDVAARFIR